MSMLSKEDYLAISTEYQREKEIVRKKCRNKMIIGFVIMAVGMILVPVILVPITFDSDFPSLAVFGIGAVVMIIGVIIAAVNSSAVQKKQEDLGIKYYQQYVADFNAKHHS